MFEDWKLELIIWNLFKKVLIKKKLHIDLTHLDHFCRSKVYQKLNIVELEKFYYELPKSYILKAYINFHTPLKFTWNTNFNLISLPYI